MGIYIEYDKPFLNYDEQISRLETNYELDIVNKDFALKAIKSLSYYDLVNGYQECMMVNGKYKSGTTFLDLYLLHMIDKDFQDIILRSSLIAENSFKNLLAYTLAKHYGVDMYDYLNKSHFKPAYNNNVVFSKVKENIFNGIRKKDKTTYSFKYFQQPTKHYAENHNHIPPWILLKNTTFSNAINLFLLLNDKLKDEICNEIITSPLPIKEKRNIIISSLHLVRKFRNVIAHNLKFITYTQSAYRLPHKTTINLIKNKSVSDGYKKFDGIYSCLIAIYILTNNTSLNSRTSAYITSWISLFSKKTDDGKLVYENLLDEYLSITNLPKDLLVRLTQLDKMIF